MSSESSAKPKIIATNKLESAPFDLQITFDQFSNRDLYANDSCVFSSPSKPSIQFFLRLHANHLEEIVLELHFVRSTIAKKVIVHSKVSLLDENGEKWNGEKPVLDFSRDFYAPQTPGGIKIFSYYRDNVVNSESELLPDDKLTFFCEFIFFTTLDSFVIAEHGDTSEELSEMQRLTRDLDSLFSTGKCLDVVLLVGGKEFPAHKAILAARSPVFEAMFRNGDTKEASESKVEISDVDVEVFEHFLRFIYTGKIPYSLNAFAGDLFVAADKYQLESLKAICEQSLVAQLSAESVHKLAVLADLHSAPVLKAAALEYFRKNTLETINSLFNSNKTEVLFKAFGALAIEDGKDETKD